MILKKKMRIGIDLDECLAENLFSFLNYYNDTYGTSLDFNEVNEYKFWTLINEEKEEAIKKASSSNQWLDQHFHNKFSKIFFTNEYGRIEERKRKADICNDLELDFFVEDDLKYALDCEKTRTKIFLLDKPWNQNVRELNKIERVYDWNGILGKIEEIKNGKIR